MKKGLSTLLMGLCCTFLFFTPLLGEAINKIENRTASLAKSISFGFENQQTFAPISAEWGDYAASTWYYTSHPGAYHSVVAISDSFSFLQGSIELDDGSIWTCWFEDMYKMDTWLATDLILISRNNAMISSYDYKLTNQNTGISIVVNLHLGPFYDSPYTRWIIDIDYYNNFVFLNDGTIWSMSFLDKWTISQWGIGNTVIIGVSDGIVNPNFLLNVDYMSQASGTAY
jgi:hypothetical protein